MSKTDSIKFWQYHDFQSHISLADMTCRNDSDLWRHNRKHGDAWTNSANWWEFLIINCTFHVADVKNMAQYVNLAGKSHQMMIKWRISLRFSWENHGYVRDFPGMWKIAGGYLKWFLMFFGYPFKHLSIEWRKWEWRIFQDVPFFSASSKLLPRCDSTTFDGSNFPIPLVPLVICHSNFDSPAPSQTWPKKPSKLCYISDKWPNEPGNGMPPNRNRHLHSTSHFSASWAPLKTGTLCRSRGNLYLIYPLVLSK